MGKILSIILGLIFLAVGIWLISLESWGQAVLIAIKACVALGLVLAGLGALAFGISELRAREEPRPIEPITAPPPVSSEPSSQPDKAE